MTLAELSTAWNDLRNAAFGRGTVPRVSRALAETVGRYYEEFRAWLADAGPLEELAPSVTAAQWVGRYRALWKMLQAEGKAPALGLTLPPSWNEQIAADAEAAATAAASAARAGWGLLELGFAALVIGAPLAIAIALARK